MNRSLRFFAAALAFLGAVSGRAQTPTEPAPIVRYSARTELSFSNVEVEGTVKGPSGDFYRARKKVGFRNLIELRSNFRPELSSSKDGL